jgi:hypothetical protein
MSQQKELKDRRAIGLPDVPFSAYCVECWEAVYGLWVEETPHDGSCPNPGGCRRYQRTAQ